MSSDLNPSPTTFHTVKPPYEKLTVLQRVGLGAGGFPDLGMQFALNSMVNPIFVVAMGVNPALVGIAMALPRFWEMLIDPWIGSMSDRTKSRYGRRHPFIFGAGILGGLIYASIWWVPQDWSAQAKGIWLIVMALIHFSAFSFFMVPYSALLGEVVSDPTERTKVMAMRSMFVSLCTVALGWLYWLCQRPVFSDPAEGMKWVGLGFGFLMAACAIIPTLVCPRTRDFQISRSAEKPPTGLAVMKELYAVTEFRGLILAVLCLLACFTLVDSLTFYVNVYFMFEGNTKAAAALTGVTSVALCVAGILASLSMGSITAKFGGWPTLRFFLCLALVGKLAQWFTMRPEWPYMAIISSVLVNLGLVSFWIFMPSLTGRISALHERRTGKSMYGSFYAFFNVTIKLAGSVSLVFTGFLLNSTGFDAAHGREQPAIAILLLRILVVCVPAVGVTIAMFALRKIWSSLQAEEDRLDAL